MSKVRTLISIAVIFSMSLNPIYGYAGDATHYGMENHIVAQPPVVGAVLKSLGDNQFCISSTIGNPDLVPSIFTEADKSYENKITDIINVFSSMGVPLCTTERKEMMQKEVQYINTSLVDSEMYFNQGRITFTFVDRVRGLVNNNITIKTGELFHLQAPSFTSIVDEEMGTSMETAIGEVQEIYTQRLSNSNEESPPQKKEPLFRSSNFNLARCGMAALTGTLVGAGGALVASGVHGVITDPIDFFVFNMVLGFLGVITVSGGIAFLLETGGDIFLLDLVCGINAGVLTFLLVPVGFH